MTENPNDECSEDPNCDYIGQEKIGGTLYNVYRCTEGGNEHVRRYEAPAGGSDEPNEQA